MWSQKYTLVFWNTVINKINTCNYLFYIILYFNYFLPTTQWTKYHYLLKNRRFLFGFCWIINQTESKLDVYAWLTSNTNQEADNYLIKTARTHYANIIYEPGQLYKPNKVSEMIDRRDDPIRYLFWLCQVHFNYIYIW